MRPFPSRTAVPIRLGAASICGLAVAMGGGALRAQEGGKTLSFDLSQRFEATSNYDLDPDSEGATYIASTGLSLDFRSVTRGQSLDLGLGGALRRIDAPDENDSESFGFADPSYSIGYVRTGPGARFSANASLQETEVSTLRRLDGFFDEDDGLVIPENIDDLDDLEGTGTRRTLSYGVSLALRQDTPFAITARADLTDTTYDDTTSSGLFDERRTEVGLETRALLTEVHTLTTDLSYTRIEDEDPSEPELGTYLGLDTTLSLDRPGGGISASLGVNETDDGTRVSVSAGIDRERPLGGIGATLGVSRGSSGDLGLIGSVNYTRASPQGVLSVQGQRSFTDGGDDVGLDGDDDGSETVTVFSANFARELTPLTSLSANASFASTTDTGDDDTTSDLSLGVSVSRALDPNWAVTAGANATFLKEDGDDWARSESIYVTLGRSFDWRF